MRSLQDTVSFLRLGVGFDDLDRAASALSDPQTAKSLKLHECHAISERAERCSNASRR